MKTLQPWQVRLSGTHLIEASAGTGKTYAITNLYLRLLLERQWTVGEILVVTYTRAATSELRDRIRTRLFLAQQLLRKILSNNAEVYKPEDEQLVALLTERQQSGQGEQDANLLAVALRSFDQAAIFTIHGFCQRVLQDSAFESGVPFDTEFMTDQAALVREIGEDFWARQMYQARPDWIRYLQACKPALKSEQFVQLANQAVKASSLPVLPSLGTSGSDQRNALLAQFTEAREFAAVLWKRDSEGIVKLLCGNPALNGNKYRAASVTGNWSAQMTQALKAETVGIPDSFTAFQRFTSAGLLDGTKKKHTPPEHEFFLACDALFEASEALVRVRLSLEFELIGYARAQLQLRKQSLGVQSFDDLLVSLSAALDSPGGEGLAAAVRSHYPGALIDEFQDTDPVQYRVFSRVYGAAATSTALFLIGDPKQAIYAFRGADIFAYMRARQDAGEDCHTLDTNWRSDPSMIRAVNCLFERAPSPFVFDEIAFHPVEHAPGGHDKLGGSLAATPALEVVLVPRLPGSKKPKARGKGAGEILVSEAVTTDIARVLNENATVGGRRVVPGDIAVLVRNNAQAFQMQRLLSQAGVPSVIDGDASVFDSEEAVELSQLLVAVVDPSNSRTVVCALSTTLLGLTGNAIAELRADEALFDEWLQKFRRWSSTWRQRGFLQAFRQLLGDQRVARGVLSKEGGGRRLTNFYHLGELLEAQAVTENLGPEALMTWFVRMQMDSTARSQSVGDTGQIRLETDSDAVQLVTVHKSKGLEYSMVYCPFLWNGAGLHKSEKSRVLFHDLEDDNRYKWDIGSEQFDEHYQWAERESLAESLRLLYVAVTRAKHHCCVYWGAFYQSEVSPLGRLLHAPNNPRTTPEGLQEWAKHIKELSDEQILVDLAALSRASDGAIGVRHYETCRAQRYEPPRAFETELRALSVNRTLGFGSRLSSFTALTSSDPVAVEVDARDVDRLRAAAKPNTISMEAASSLDMPTAPVALAEFPRGARVGVMLHDIFENAPFKDATEETLELCVDSAMERFGVASELRETLLSAVHDMLHTPLRAASVEGSAIKLSDLEREQRIDEMEFLFPVSGQPRALMPRALGEVLAQYQQPPWPADYPQKVSGLGFVPLSGFLRGFVDLIFCHEGRYYVVDYKSNFLGPQPQDYAPEKLQEAMGEGHYYLQSLIYLVALHRYLRLRIADYQYEQHIGGIYYLFLRGMAPTNPLGLGVYADRPPLSLIEALSQLFGEVGDAEARVA